MIQSPDYHTDDSCQPEFSYPPIQVAEHRGAPLVSWSGLAIIRQLVERLGVAPAIDAAVRVLRRCKWYTESDHILTMIYNMLTGGSTLSAINRFRDDQGAKRLLGTERIPHATTTGDFLARFGEDRNAVALSELREVGEDLQQQSFAMLPRVRREVATIDLDSSIHEVYGEKKEGADFAYNNTWSYSVLYGTLAETGDLLYMDLREGYRHTSYGSQDVLPGMIKRVGEHFRAVRMRADSGYYDQKLVQICAARGVEFFIVAKKHANVMKAVHALPASAWNPFQANELSRGGRSGRRRKRRENRKRKITIERRPKSWFKGKPEIASMVFRPDSWSEPYRFVIKRTPIIDKDDKQLYLDDGMRKYAYWIVVTNSTRSNTAVLRIAQGRGNQENLIKDFKHGLGLSHVPTGFLAANRAYFLIAALAWNLKTWMLNLLQLGDGAVLRFKRFLYLWICQAGMVATTGRGVLLKLPAGEYYQRFGKAFSRLAALPV